MPRSQVLEVLRRETRTQHAALEQTAPMVALLRDDVSFDHYRQVLAAMRACYAPLERELLPALEKMQHRFGPLPYAYTVRVPLLDRDLEACGVQPTEYSGSAPFTSLTAEQAIGVLYVLEGATQGGRIIAPHITKVLGLDTGNGLGLFSLYRSHKGWEGYCHWLTELNLSSLSAPVEAARLVFEDLSLRLKELCVEVQQDG